MARLGTASDRAMSRLHAAMNIEPILGQFYASLSDQQRRRFNSAIRKRPALVARREPCGFRAFAKPAFHR